MPNNNKKINKITDIERDVKSFVFEESEKNEQEHEQFSHDIQILDNKIENIQLIPGDKGDTGEKGDKGDKGDPGRDGKDGVDGRDGKDGKQGIQGKSGRQGNPGKKGDKGDKGEKGEPGIPGKDGKSDFSMFSRATYPAVKLGESLLTTGVREFKFEDLNLDVTKYEGSKINVKVSDTPTFDYIDFDTTTSYTSQEGRLGWNAEDGTLQIGMPGGNVTLQIGQEHVVRAKNVEAVQINNGQVVYISGGSGSRPEVMLADADSSSAHTTIAVATENVAASQSGFYTTTGLVRDIDTSSWAAGTQLYLSQTTGELTSTQPTAPAHKVEVAIVVRQHATEGVIFVKIDAHPNLDEASNVNVTSISNAEILAYNSGSSVWENKVPTVDIPIALTSYNPQPARADENNISGGLLSLATAQALNSVPTNITVTKGIGKIMIVVNAGSDISGNITVTGTSVDRNTGATTASDTDTITVDALTTDNSDTDTNGNTRHSFTGAYITSKWFTGSVTLSTSDLTLTDVDVYHVSFEQFNDAPNLTLNTFDANIYTTNVAAEFDAYLYCLEVTGDKCDITRRASLNVGADGETAIANKYWRLRRGNVNYPLDGTTDGVWIDVHYSNSPAYVEDVTLKVWATKSQPLTLT